MNSKRPVAPEGYTPHNRQLAVVPEGSLDSGRGATRALVRGLIWCLVGSTSVYVVPVISCVLIAFGMAAASQGAGRRGEIVTLLVSLVGGAAGTYLLAGPFNIPSVIVSVICSYAMAWCVTRGKAYTGWLLLASAMTAVAMIGIDMVSTSLQGTSITELFTSVVNEVVESSSGALDLDGTTALLEAKSEILAYWPTIYFAVGLSMALCAFLGARSGARLAGAPLERGLIVSYDVPLWVAELFALGVAAELLGPRLPTWASEATMIGANVVLCARIALAQQGLSVLQWWMRERRVSPLTWMLVIPGALWLETSFALASVVGLLDVAINFRHFVRGRADLVLWPTRER